MLRECPTLPKLPEREHDQQATESEWSKDSALYEACRAKHNALSRFDKDRAQAFRKK